MQPGDKPWFIAFVLPGLDTGSNVSTHCMKTLYFLQKYHSEEVNVGYFTTKDDETLREVFENAGLPQSIYIKDGKPYY